MAQITLLPLGIRVPLAEGERLLDVLDDLERPVLPLACRAMNCGICRVRLQAGNAAMRAATPREQQLLRQLGAAPDERLACQLVLETDAPDLEIAIETRAPR